MTNKTLNLDDAASPEEVIRVLRNAANRFAGDAGELQSAWQDKNAGRFWAKLSRELERLADRMEKVTP